MSGDSTVLLVVALQRPEALEHAKRLVQMAAKLPNDMERTSVSGASIIVAIAYLTQSVEFRLMQALANREASEGRYPDEISVRARMPNGLPSRMRLLPTVQCSLRMQLDDRKPKTRMLFDAVRLRNRLVHEAGEYAFGSAESLGATINEGRLTLQLELPPPEWGKATVEYAEAVIEAAEEFGLDFDRVSESCSADESEFFRSVPTRGGAR